MPDKLREMQELFLLEAAKYPNLPLTGPNDVDAQQHRLLRDHHVALPDDPDLIDELANSRPLETAPSNYRIDHDSSEHDDRVISLAIAAHRLVTTSARPNVDSKKLAAAMAQISADLYKPSGGAFDY